VSRRITWKQALRLVTGVWLLLGGAFAVLRMTGDEGLPVPMPAVMFLGNWYYHHREQKWPAVGAAITGCTTALLLVDRLRDHMDRLSADTLTSAVAVVPAVLVLTVLSYVRPRPPLGG
jgi:phosphatidylserine synthase